MGKMSREDLFREIGEIDEKYVEEARRGRRRRRLPSWVGKTLVAAASLVFCVGVGYMTVLVIQPKGNVGGSTGSALDMNGSVMEAAQEQCSMAEDADGQMAGSAAAEEAGAGQEHQGVSLPEAEQSAQRGTETGALEEAPAAAEAAPTGVPAVSEAGLEKPTQQTDSSNTESNSGQGASGQILESKEELGTLEDMEGVLQYGDSTTALTWEAARTDAVYGRYVDVQVPEGYSFTGGMRSTAALRVTWNKGMEEIAIICRQADESVSDWLVDVEKPEEYDLGLYTIPWCDSVPPELIQQVSNATFLSDQITPEILDARTYQVQEAGDVSGTRIQIGILYGDNVLVEINSKGPSAEEIYTMINLENQV